MSVLFECFRTRENHENRDFSQKKSQKNHEKTRFFTIFIFASFGNRRFMKIRVGTSFSSFFRTRLDSRKLVDWNSTRNFGKKFGMQGPSSSLFFFEFFFYRTHTSDKYTLCQNEDISLWRHSDRMYQTSLACLAVMV